MSKFKVGQEVRCIADHFSYISKGHIYNVAALHTNGRIRLAGIDSPYSSNFFVAVEYPPAEHVPEPEGLLSAVEVTQAVVDNLPLEYHHTGNRNRKDYWVKVAHPHLLSLDTILRGKFRKYVERIEINGVEVAKPTIDTKTQVVDPNVQRFSININLQDVTKVYGRYNGAPLWDTAEDAHAALTAILAPFGVTPRPLSEMCL